MTWLQLRAADPPQEARELRAEVRRFLSEERECGGYRVRCDNWLSGIEPEFTRKLGRRG